MRTLEDVIVKVDQLNDFMICVEDAMIAAANESDTGEEMAPGMKRLHSIVYVLMDQLAAVGKDLEEANGHITVRNAILASAHVRQMEAELARLKAKEQ